MSKGFEQEHAEAAEGSDSLRSPRPPVPVRKWWAGKRTVVPGFRGAFEDSNIWEGFASYPEACENVDQAATGNGAMALLFPVARHPRAVPEQRR